MQPVKSSEKRMDYRRRYLAEISYGTDKANGKGYIRDISLGGVLIAADRRVPIGTDVLVTLPFPNSTRCISLRGTVVRLTDEGFAVGFKRRKQNYYQDPGQDWQTSWAVV